MTQGDFADRLGLTQPSISAWERDEALPSADQLPRIARVLGCSVEDLVVGVDPAYDRLRSKGRDLPDHADGATSDPHRKGVSDVVPAAGTAAQTRVLTEVTEAYERLSAEVRSLHETLGAIVKRVERDPLGLKDRTSATKPADRRRRRGTAR